MEWSEDYQELNEWIPLIMAGRDLKVKVAATSSKYSSGVSMIALMLLG